MPDKQLTITKGEKPQGLFRILRVEQRHERSGRVVTLIDAESMGEIKTDLRKRQFSYQILGMTDTTIKPGFWLLSPREDIGIISEVENITKKQTRKKSPKRVVLRVKFEDTGSIRLNETWTIFKKQPVTRREMGRWEKRMTEDASQYYWQILPGVLDKVLFEPTEGVNGDQVRKIRNLQNQILYQAIKKAKSKESVKLTSTHLVEATREILEPFDKD